MTDPVPICLSPDQLRSLLEDAGEQGARRTLARLGLEDEKAVQDLREVRDILSAWRSARRIALETIVRTLTIGLLALLAAGFAFNWFGDGKPPRH